MQGVLLDPRSGSPVDQANHYRDYLAGTENWLDAAVKQGRLPESVAENMARAAAKPRGSGPTATKQGFNEVLAVDLADGTQILNTTTEIIIVPDYTFAANDPHIYPGATFRLTCYYDVSFVITTPGTLTFRLRWGGVAGTVIAQTGAYAPDPTAALANRSGWIETLMTVRTIGAAGSIFAMGRMMMNDVDDASATSLQGNLNMTSFGSAGASTPAVVTALDMTSAKALSISAQFSVATATTQLTNHLRTLECLN